MNFKKGSENSEKERANLRLINNERRKQNQNQRLSEEFNEKFNEKFSENGFENQEKIIQTQANLGSQSGQTFKETACIKIISIQVQEHEDLDNYVNLYK